MLVKQQHFSKLAALSITVFRCLHNQIKTIY